MKAINLIGLILMPQLPKEHGAPNLVFLPLAGLDVEAESNEAEA
jgi:hypothetical protein